MGGLGNFNPYLLFNPYFNQQIPNLDQNSNLQQNQKNDQILNPNLKTALDENEVNEPRAEMQFAPPITPRANVQIASESVRKVYKRLEKLLSEFVDTISGYTNQIVKNAGYRAMVETDDKLAVSELENEENMLKNTLKTEEDKIFNRLRSIDKKEAVKQRKRMKENRERKRQERLEARENKKRTFLGQKIENSLKDFNFDKNEN